MPVVLHNSAERADGYAEGAVTNTRFGSFPHSTLLDLPWGSQVLASKVDTGSRGRANKRKRDHVDDADASAADRGAAGNVKAAVTAGSGFVHLLPPTPESWTISLPHRTQVVYTPDYSYVLQRLRVRPGHTIIEAGAGSGSFTHASARAVFNGYPTFAPEPSQKKRKYGRVCSFEYHEPRANTLRQEMTAHGLDDIVTVTHRDVYENGFNLNDANSSQSVSPNANAVFLDLPQPWLALKHLTRRPISSKTAQAVTNPEASPAPGTPLAGSSTAARPDSSASFISPLNPLVPVHVCCFSPCIEQVTSTVAALRRLGWTEIEMVEVIHRRLDVRRERVGLHEEGLRGVNATAANVNEAVERLREVEGRFKEWREITQAAAQTNAGAQNGASQTMEVEGQQKGKTGDNGASAQGGNKSGQSRAERLEKIKRDFETRKIYKEGRLVHRTEPEIRTHTSYLVFAILPREWTEEDEEKMREKWGAGPGTKDDAAAPKTKKGERGGKKQPKKGKSEKKNGTQEKAEEENKDVVMQEATEGQDAGATA